MSAIYLSLISAVVHIPRIQHSYTMDSMIIPQPKSRMSQEEIEKAIQELRHNHKTSLELYELNKKAWKTNWVTESKLLTRWSLIVGIR